MKQKKAGVSIRIAHSHSTKNEGNIIERFIKSYYGNFMNNATDQFACSREAAEFLFGKNNKAIILKNGIEVDKYIFSDYIRNRIRSEWNVQDEFVIGHVGRCDEAKNQSYLIDIFSEIYKINKKTRLILVGDGVMMGHLRTKVKKKGLSATVKFLGVCENVNELLQGFDVFVFPSIFEGLPVTVIEAQASGLKCVLSDTITREVDISGNVEFVSLKELPSIWADKILKHNRKYKREDIVDAIKKYGYDIRYTAQFLEQFYLKDV